MRLAEITEVPPLVDVARGQNWGVTIDAYLVGAVRVGDRYSALVYLDLSGAIEDGMTVVTRRVQTVTTKAGFQLVQTLSGHDHYVIVSQHR